MKSDDAVHHDANIPNVSVSSSSMSRSDDAAVRLQSTSLPLPTWRLVTMLALPVLAQQGLYFIVSLSDRWLAGHLQAETSQATLQAAQTTALYLAWSINCYTILVTVGSTALVARFIGAGERHLAVEVTHQALLLAVVLAGIATLWAILGGIRGMVEMLQLQGDTAHFAAAYLYPLFLLLIFQMIQAAGNACLVGAGDTRTGLWVMIGVAVVNIPLAWGFAWGWGPLPQLGFVGIAVGTALSHTIGGLVILGVLTRGRFGLKLKASLFRPRYDLLRRLLRVSIPAGFDSLVLVAGQFWFLAIINQLLDVASSAHGIALVWESLGYLSGAAFGTAAMALVGQNLGAGRPDQAARAGWRAFALGVGVMTFMGAVFFTFAPEMFALFCPKPEQQPIIAAGVPVLRLVAFTMPCLASMIVFSSALRGAGDTRVPVVFTLIGFFVVRIPLAYYLTRPNVLQELLGASPDQDLRLLGAWCAMFADIIIRGIFFFYRFAQGTWKKQKV